MIKFNVFDCPKHDECNETTTLETYYLEIDDKYLNVMSHSVLNEMGMYDDRTMFQNHYLIIVQHVSIKCLDLSNTCSVWWNNDPWTLLFEHGEHVHMQCLHLSPTSWVRWKNNTWNILFENRETALKWNGSICLRHDEYAEPTILDTGLCFNWENLFKLNVSICLKHDEYVETTRDEEYFLRIVNKCFNGMSQFVFNEMTMMRN